MASKHRASMDPISRLQLPPRGETPAQRVERLVQEEKAQKISDAIDKALDKERKEQFTKLKARKEDLLLLLLGPSGSGKSTFLRQLRLMYDRDGLARERDGYRLAIFLSLVHTTRCLLDLLEASQNASQRNPPLLSALPAFQPPSDSQTPKGESSLRRLRLAPLLGLEEALRTHLGVVATSGPSANSFNRLAEAPLRERRNSLIAADTKSIQSDTSSLTEVASDPSASYDFDEVYQVFPSRWNGTTQQHFSTATHAPGSKNNSAAHLLGPNWVAPAGDPSYLFESCYDEIKGLWDECIGNGLIADDGPNREQNQGGARLSDSARYFMTSLKRVANRRYQPTDEDLMHARVRTVGIEEHFLKVESQMYHIVDVAGAKGLRPVWASFFEHARSVIFITSLGEYDEPCQHDPKTNSLIDAIHTFKDICMNRLLLHVDLILFLNKIDIVKRKVRSGRNPPSLIFSDFPGPDDHKTFARYARDKFRDIAVTSSKPDRVLYVHLTVATSIEQTKLTIQSVKDTLVRRHLEFAGLA